MSACGRVSTPRTPRVRQDVTQDSGRNESAGLFCCCRPLQLQLRACRHTCCVLGLLLGRGEGATGGTLYPTCISSLVVVPYLFVLDTWAYLLRARLAAKEEGFALLGWRLGAGKQIRHAGQRVPTAWARPADCRRLPRGHTAFLEACGCIVLLLRLGRLLGACCQAAAAMWAQRRAGMGWMGQ